LIGLKNDKIKTIVLILLVLNSMFLTAQIWLSEKLWSQDYNFFVKWENNELVQAVLKKVSWSSGQDHKGPTIDSYFYTPQRIVVNYGSFRTVYVNGDNLYAQYLSEISRAFEQLLRSEEGVKYQAAAATDEWFNVLKTKSIYVDLRAPYKTKLLGQFFGIKETPLSTYIKDIKELILVPGDSISNDITFYIKNFSNGSIGKFNLNYDRTPLNNLLEKHATAPSNRYKFSFEIPLDKKSRFTKVVVDSSILIPLDKQNLKVLKSNNPVKSEHDIKDILKAFKYSSNSLRKYTEMDNTIVYVENYSTLKIHPDGLIEYDAIEGGKGLKLAPVPPAGGNNMPSFRESWDMVVKFIKGIENVNQEIQLSSAAEDQNKPGTYQFIFNYFYGGLPITMSLDNGKIQDAIKVEVVNGTLKSYRHYLRNYEEVKPVEVGVSMPYVLDNIYKKIDAKQDDITITDLFLGYEESSGEDTLQPRWNFRIEGTGKRLTIPVGKK
jgi:hypothetical protein